MSCTSNERRRPWRRQERSPSSPEPAAASGVHPRWRCWRMGFRSCWPGVAARCSRRRPHSPRLRRHGCLLFRPMSPIPPSIAALFDTVNATLWPDRSAVQQRRHQHPQHPDRGSDVRAMVERRRGQPDRFVSLRAARVSHDEEPAAAWRAHHQQRVGLGACAAAQLDSLLATKHALTGLTRSLSLDGREYDIACGQIDIGNAATTRNEDTARGRLQASGKVEAEARIDVNDVARGVAYMASLSLEANVQFMTVMATKMPYIGRG